MKALYRISTACSLMLAVLVVACSVQQQKPDQPQVLKTTIALPTLKCNTCARHIKHALAGVDGITDAAVSVDDKNIVVTYAADKIDAARIEQAISKSGYDANSTKRDPAAYESLSECCK